MTEKEIEEFCIGNGFTETTIAPFATERTFVATYINNNEITITFNKGQDSYEYVTINTSDGILSSMPIPTDQLKNMNFQQPTKLVNTAPDISVSDEDFNQSSGSDKLTEGTEEDKKSPNLMYTGEKAPSTPDEFSESTSNSSTSNGEPGYEEKITFNTEAFEVFKNIIVVDIDDIKKLHRYICNACSYLTVDIKQSLNKVVASFDSLNNLTKEKVKSEWDYQITMAEKQTYKINSSFNDIISNLKDKIAKNEKTNEDKTGSTRYNGPINVITPEEPTIPVDLDNLNKLTPAIAGVITFTEVISMYTSIGSETVVQSSLAGNYGLLGLIHRNDKYYYKIIDKATGQVYFVEMNDKSKVEWDEREERKAVEIIGKEANILKLPQEGDVLVRNPEVGDVYFLNGEKMTFDGIDYYFISDNVTGEVGYIPVNTSLSEPVLVSELGSVTSDNVSEVK